jgi:hypothetical protein
MGTNDIQILIKGLNKLKQKHPNYALYNAGILDAIEVVKAYKNIYGTNNKVARGS